MSIHTGLTRTPLRRFLDYAVLSVLAFIFALPVIYLFMGSLKPSDEVLNGLSGFLPTHLSFDNYTAVLDSLNSDSTGYFWRFMGISLLLSFVVVTGGLFVNSMAAYGPVTCSRWFPGLMCAESVPVGHRIEGGALNPDGCPLRLQSCERVGARSLGPVPRVPAGVRDPSRWVNRSTTHRRGSSRWPGSAGWARCSRSTVGAVFLPR
ncbi:hypothetical protein SHIRM173S_06238 [Streptomyces hirsutus]